MDLNIHEIIRRPVISEKSSLLLNKYQKVVLEVHPQANKQEIAKAIQRLFDVKVENVRIINRKGKVKNFKRKKYQKPLSKRAIITLKEGYSFDQMGQMPGHQMPIDASAVSAETTEK